MERLSDGGRSREANKERNYNNPSLRAQTITMTASTTESHAYAELAKPDTNNATYLAWFTLDNDDEWSADFRFKKKRDHYEYLDQMNQGRRNLDWWNKEYETYRANRDVASTLADKLELMSGQRRRAMELFTGLDLQQLGHPTNPVAFCVCAFVVHSDDTGRKCHPQTTEADFDDCFAHLMVELDIRQKQFASIYGKVAHRIQRGELRHVEHDKYGLDEAQQFVWRTDNADEEDGWL